MEDVKMKLAVFWLFIVITMSSIITIAIMAPGVIDDIRSGILLDMEINQEMLLIMAITYYWIPLVMAVVSITLKDSINRWLNIIAGAGFAIYILIELILNITTVAYLFGMLMDISAILVSALIAWYAWKWPKD